MLADGSVLVALLEAVARIPLPPPPRRGRGRPVVSPDRLFLQGLVIMIVRRRETVALLMAVLNAPTIDDIDETIERRRGVTIAAKGIERDLVCSSHRHLVKAGGVRRRTVAPCC